MDVNFGFSRRQWIASTGGLILAAHSLKGLSAAAQPQPCQQQTSDPLGKDLIFHGTDPRNGEPALENLVKSWITPTEHFYVRSHAPNPEIDPAKFVLKVDGLVENPLEISLAELGKLKRIETTATLTCAGNRRDEYNEVAKVGGLPWGPGAIGNATWSGFSLAELLDRAGVKANARHVCFEGLDQIKRKDGVIPFGASIALERAMQVKSDAPVLLADRMNGAPLTADHGFPLRTVVPGYIGARSVKWLGRITVSDRPSENHYVATAYKIVKNTFPLDWQEAGPIYRFPINAAVHNPGTVKAGKVTLTGYALASGRPGTHVAAIRVSTDEKNWVAAKPVSQRKDFCWMLWTVELELKPGKNTVTVHASDNKGAFMPMSVQWNAKGYLQNSWYRTVIEAT